MRCLYRTRPYELVKGSANELYEKMNALAVENMKSLSFSKFNKLTKQIIYEFDHLPLDTSIRKPRIGVVGEILVKFHPAANNDIVNLIEQEGAEAVVPDFLDFFLYCASDYDFKYKYLSAPWYSKTISDLLVWTMNKYRGTMIKCFKQSQRFGHPIKIQEMAKLVDDIIQLGHMTGEGWLLTAEMVELLRSGVSSIACLQPFACLPNHVTGKGMIKELKRRFPQANISAIDYDPGASEVNQLNRLKLLLSNATVSPNPDEPRHQTKIKK